MAYKHSALAARKTGYVVSTLQDWIALRPSNVFSCPRDDWGSMRGVKLSIAAAGGFRALGG